jgi:hypothetical protein
LAAARLGNVWVTVTLFRIEPSLKLIRRSPGRGRRSAANDRPGLTIQGSCAPVPTPGQFAAAAAGSEVVILPASDAKDVYDNFNVPVHEKWRIGQ